VIDRKVFAGVMGGFADRFGRALAPATADMYYDILAAELTTEEFLAGARIVFQKHTYNAWPAPQLFIDDPAAKDLVSDLASKLVAPEPKQIERAPMTRNSGQISEVAR
jgi:hypothetical protein